MRSSFSGGWLNVSLQALLRCGVEGRIHAPLPAAPPAAALRIPRYNERPSAVHSIAFGLGKTTGLR